jgi:MFS superfamily sulfate permease-like transporter
LQLANIHFALKWSSVETINHFRTGSCVPCQCQRVHCSAVNSIDASALESLEAIDSRLRDSGILLHLSEVKGPVMDRLKHTHFLRDLSGKVYLTHYQAVQDLS